MTELAAVTADAESAAVLATVESRVLWQLGWLVARCNYENPMRWSRWVSEHSRATFAAQCSCCCPLGDAVRVRGKAAQM